MTTIQQLIEQLNTITTSNLKEKLPNFIQEFDQIKTYYTSTLETLSVEENKFKSKLIYFSGLLSIVNKTYNQKMFETFKKDFLTLTETFIKNEDTYQKNLLKSKFLKDKFFINKWELIIFLKCNIGYYLIYNSQKGLRVFNLTSNHNGYHIFWDWRFCSGTTYSSLRQIAEQGDIYSFIMFLINILSNYDDKVYHLATPQNFIQWKKFDKNETCTEGEYNTIKKIIENKYERMIGYIWGELSEEGKEYIDKKCNILLEELYLKVK